MKQRVALARALAPNPRMLLMDEPFAALDALTREQLYGDLQQIWESRRKTIIFVTHNVREAACLGDRVLLFSPHPGRIREEFRSSCRDRATSTASTWLNTPPRSCVHSKDSKKRTERWQNEANCLFHLIFCRPGSSLGPRSASGRILVAGALAFAGERGGVSQAAAIDGTLWQAILITVKRLLIGYVVGLVGGIPLGLLTRAGISCTTPSARLRSAARLFPASAGSRWHCFGLAKVRPRCFSWWSWEPSGR